MGLVGLPTLGSTGQTNMESLVLKLYITKTKLSGLPDLQRNQEIEGK